MTLRRNLPQILELLRGLLAAISDGTATPEEQQFVDDLCLWYDGYRKGQNAEAVRDRLRDRVPRSVWSDGPSPLAWKSNRGPNYPVDESCTSLGIRYRVCQSSASGNYYFECGGDSVRCESVEQGRAICNDHNRARILTAFRSPHG